MAQHDMDIANGSGAVFRADLNDALEALVTTSKGPSAPSTAFAGQQWVDDNTPSGTVWTLNMYDGSGWRAMGTLSTSASVFVPNGVMNLGSASTVGIAPVGDGDTGIWSPGNDTWSVSTGGVERLRLTQGGLFGFGTTPTTLGHFSNLRDDTVPARVTIQNTNASGGVADLVLRDERGSTDYKRVSLRNVQGVFQIGRFDDSETGFYEWARFNNTDGDFRINTVVTQMRSDEKVSISGTLGVKAPTTTTPSLAVGSVDNTFLAEFYNSSTVSCGSITVAGGGTGVAFNTTSDARLKTVVQDEFSDETMASLLSGLRPYMTTRIDAPGVPAQMTFLAQEVAAVLPEAVTTGSDAGPGEPGFRPFTMDYGRTAPALALLVRWLAARTAALEARVAALEA